MTTKLLPLALALALALAACAAPAATPAGPRTLTLMTHNSFAVSDSVLKEFETAHNVKVQLLKSSDAGILVNTALLNKAARVADVLYGVYNTLLSRALDGGLFDQYKASALA
ncbi:MAG: thiamine ABC transporter substrate-binding protein, partial [Chloroflexi bacterium]|nr:thiamine ABC transporter substrate-binding protein [Chloroflexota bacterium]